MRMLSKSEIASIIVVAAILSISGFICGTFHSLNSTLVFTKEINLIQLASLMTTIFGLIFISIYLDRQKEMTKLQREILIKRVDSLYENLSTISPLIENGPVELCEINANLKKIAIGIQRIGKVINIVMNKKCEILSESLELHRRLRKLMTDTPAKSSLKMVPLDINVEKGKVSYSQSRKEQIDGLIDEIETTLLRQHLAITRPN